MILAVQNRQRRKRIDTRFLGRMTRELLSKHLSVAEAELGIHLVGAREMAEVNQQFLNHQGSTDVITFDHRERPVTQPTFSCPIHGELFICVEDAEIQAREFGTSWPEELVRYVVHGVLHLCGFDDLEPKARRRMKAQEGRLLRELCRAYDPADLERKARPRSRSR